MNFAKCERAQSQQFCQKNKNTLSVQGRFFCPQDQASDQPAPGTTLIWHISPRLAATITVWEALNLQYLSSFWLRLTLDAAYTSNTAKTKQKKNQNKNQKPPFPIRLLKNFIGSWSKPLFQVAQEMKRRFCIKDRDFPDYCDNKLYF